MQALHQELKRNNLLNQKAVNNLLAQRLVMLLCLVIFLEKSKISRVYYLPCLAVLVLLTLHSHERNKSRNETKALLGILRIELLNFIKADDVVKVTKALKELHITVHDKLNALTQRTLLHYAVESGAEKLVACALEAKANLNAQDKEGNTPLHIAIKCIKDKNPKGYPILKMLLGDYLYISAPLTPGFFSQVAGRELKFENKIDFTLLNHARQSVLDLVDTIPDKESNDFKIIYDNILRATDSMQRHQAEHRVKP